VSRPLARRPPRRSAARIAAGRQNFRVIGLTASQDPGGWALQLHLVIPEKWKVSILLWIDLLIDPAARQIEILLILAEILLWINLLIDPEARQIEILLILAEILLPKLPGSRTRDDSESRVPPRFTKVVQYTPFPLY
jgi:hypothetical protein